MKNRIDWSWRSWGFHAYRPQGWYRVDTPIGSFGIDHHRSVTESWLSRGRCRQWDLRIPVTKDWQIHLSTPGKDYLTLVEGPDYLRNLNWILDEFDSSFNDLATASLRYHLEYSVCDNEDQRERYEDIIARLNEPCPKYTEEEEVILHPPGRERGDDFELRGDGAVIFKSSPERRDVYAAYRQREEEWLARVDQARHDFVDIMRYLWS
ncbi:hypothetical protein PBI_DUKE13_63 [Mycobacterium phage Duke13]|uniref:Uncharacterized protein n=1 Tax=Mycobacterium phage Duke13 TaxID=2499038 RepID=A0A3S9UAV7_9CAUD|nr:hypothetical protein PBI_DUKE13_63 [Mycobacterium phage Duke13]